MEDLSLFDAGTDNGLSYNVTIFKTDKLSLKYY